MIDRCHVYLGMYITTKKGLALFKIIVEVRVVMTREIYMINKNINYMWFYNKKRGFFISFSKGILKTEAITVNI